MIPTGTPRVGPGSTFNFVTARYNESVDAENTIRNEMSALETISEANFSKFSTAARDQVYQHAWNKLQECEISKPYTVNTIDRYKSKREQLKARQLETPHENWQGTLQRWPNRSGFDQDEKDHERHLISTIATYGRLTISSDQILPVFRDRMREIYQAHIDYLYNQKRSKRRHISTLRIMDKEVEKAKRECEQVKQTEALLIKSFMAQPTRSSCIVSMYGRFIYWTMSKDEKREEELEKLAEHLDFTSIEQMNERLGERFIMSVKAAQMEVDVVGEMVVRWYLKSIEETKMGRCRLLVGKVTQVITSRA